MNANRTNSTANSRSSKFEKKLDACGLKCPEPVMMLHNALTEAADGQLISMQATDPTTVRDVKNFCKYLGHTLESHKQEEDVFHYTIRKKTSAAGED